MRARLVYAAFSTSSDGLVFVAHLAQYIEARYEAEKDEAYRVLRKAYKVLHEQTSIDGLRFVPLNPTTVEIVTCIDAAFAVYKDESSQLGIIFMLRDSATGRANVLHYASRKSKNASSLPSCSRWSTGSTLRKASKML